MSHNPWVAVDATTIPAKRARELRDAWEDFVDGRETDDERLLAVVQGLTACDVALAKTVLDRAVANGVGQIIDPAGTGA